jgi:hypothetical protein
MDLDPANLLSGLVLSSIGFGLFIYGKKQRRSPQLLAGVLLMVLPILPVWLWLQWAATGLVIGGTWYASRAGW